MALSKYQYCHRFPLDEIKLATEDFRDAYVIGKGGFGKVYECFLICNTRLTLVAVKRLHEHSKQGLPEFDMEIETLGKIRHRNILSLIGYCEEEGEMLLVYEHIPNHTLHHHLELSREGLPSLSWKQRFRILIGAGRGLDHLHYGFPGKSVIHRDFKSENILLDENFVAKVADFGLAKLLGMDISHVIASLKFSFGYVDPSFTSSGGILTLESDTFAFGVVILEALTGLTAFDSSRGDEACLYIWASKREAHEIVDRDVSGNMSEDSLRLCVEVARRCLDMDPKKRPSMTHVVVQLELALQGLDSHLLIQQPEISESTQENDETNHLQDEFHRLLQGGAGHGDLPPLPGIPIHESEDIMNAIMLPEPEAAPAIEEEDDGRGKNQSVDVQPIEEEDEEEGVENKPNVDMRPLSAPAIEEEEDGRGKNQCVDVQPIAAPAPAPADRIVDMLQIDIPTFPIAEIKDITDNFSDEYLIAKVSGGGSVFRGVLRSGQIAAIRKLDKEFPVHDFLTQVSKVSRLKHENVVQLIGYCFDDGLQLFIYEFGPWGSLHDILHVESGRAFSLSQRIKIAVEAGKGLLYLHQKDLIHSNIRSSNVLVFDNDIAKISSLHQRNARCNCRKYYFDGRHPHKFPPCFRSHPPGFLDTGNSKAGDVYHFGILLLELLTGCEGFSLKIDVEDFVANLKRRKVNIKSLTPIMDAGLKGNYPFMAAAKVAEVAIECLQYEAHLRPNMTTVVKDLQFAHQSSQDSLQMHQHNKSNHTSSNNRPTEASTSNSNDRDFQRPNEQDRIFQTADSVADNQQSPKPVDAKSRGCWGQIWKIPRIWSNSREVKVS